MCVTARARNQPNCQGFGNPLPWDFKTIHINRNSSPRGSAIKNNQYFLIFFSFVSGTPHIYMLLVTSMSRTNHTYMLLVTRCHATSKTFIFTRNASPWGHASQTNSIYILSVTLVLVLPLFSYLLSPSCPAPITPFSCTLLRPLYTRLHTVSRLSF